jgi:hypothetical protein
MSDVLKDPTLTDVSNVLGINRIKYVDSNRPAATLSALTFA